MKDFPIHNFSVDDNSSIPFKLIPLQRKASYDTSVAHRHNYYEIFFFNKGGGVHNIDFEIHDIHTNSVHFVSPGQVHCVMRELDTFGYVVLFSREFFSMQRQNLSELFDMAFLHNSPDPILNLDEKDMDELSAILSDLEHEQKNGSLHDQTVIRALLKILLCKCDRFHRKLFPDHQWSKNELFRDFRLLLESDFTSSHKVQDYADKLGVTTKKLNICVKNSTGKTVSEVIMNRVMLEAKRLLLNSERSVKEIAFGLGFNDQAHFTKYFKSKTDQSPNTYRLKAEKYKSPAQ